MEGEDREDMKIQTTEIIQPCLADLVMYHVIDVESANDIWMKLESEFLDKTTPNKLHPERSFLA